MNVSIFRPGWAGGWRGLLGLLLGLWLLAGTAWAQGHDQVRIGVQLEPPLLDPTVTAAATAGEITYVNIFEGLTVLDGEGQPPFKDEIVVAQRQNIGLIGAVRGRGQPEQEAGLEVV